VRKAFDRLDEAKAWRADATVGLRQGTMRGPSRITLHEAAEAWLDGVRAGTIRNRSGDAYKPSVIRGYESALMRKIRPALGAHRLSDIRRVDVQDFADRMLAAGDDPSTIRNALMPLRAIYRRATARGEVGVNPTLGIELPAVRGRRERIVSPDEAAKLIRTAPVQDKALWATALYTGLRQGELMALRWEDIDLAAGVIRVERSWDVREGAIEPKSRAGKRTGPIAVILRDHLVEHKMQTGRESGLVFGRSATTPFDPVSLATRASRAWVAAKLAGITLHEARHTFASLMIAAGVNAKALSSYMGHASVTITYDRYGHLMLGNEDEAARLLDDYLQRADTRARTAQVDESF
jgi:integrase